MKPILYAQVKGRTVLKYPVSPHDENKNTSFPLHWNGGKVGDKTYVKVLLVDRPLPGFGQEVVEETPKYIKGVLTQVFKAVNIETDVYRILILNKLDLDYENKKKEGLKTNFGNFSINDNLTTLKTYAAASDEILLESADKFFIRFKSKDALRVIEDVIVHGSHLYSVYTEAKSSITLAKTYDEIKSSYEGISW